MSASYEQISLNSNESFYIGVFQDNIEKGTWHYHNKLELTFVTEGKGKRIVGDSIEDFYPGDLIFIGAKIPHVWIAEKNEFGTEKARSLESVYLQFGQNIIPDEVLKLPEFADVKKAIKLSQRGVHITGDTLNEVSSLMLELPYKDNFSRIIYFYRIMDAIGKSSSNILLASEDYVARRFNSTNERITKIHEYLMSYSHEEVNLEKLAQLIHMAPGSLCRFFKSEMGMTIFDYLNKIKVDYACSLLLDRELSIAGIAYDCGFNNLSHFNKQFKKNMNITPSQYRKQFERMRIE